MANTKKKEKLKTNIFYTKLNFLATMMAFNVLSIPIIFQIALNGVKQNDDTWLHTDIGLTFGLIIFILSLISAVSTIHGGKRLDAVFIWSTFFWGTFILFIISFAASSKPDLLGDLKFFAFIIFWAYWALPSMMFPALQFSRFPIPKIMQNSPSISFLIWQLMIAFDLMLLDFLSLFDFIFSILISVVSAYFLFKTEKYELNLTSELVSNKIDDQSVNLLDISNLSTFRIANHKFIPKLFEKLQQKKNLSQMSVDLSESQFTLESNLNNTSYPNYFEWIEEVYHKEKSISKLIKGKPQETKKRILGIGLIFLIMVFNTFLISSILLDANIKLWQLLLHLIIFTSMNLIAVLILLTMSFEKYHTKISISISRSIQSMS